MKKKNQCYSTFSVETILFSFFRKLRNVSEKLFRFVCVQQETKINFSSACNLWAISNDGRRHPRCNTAIRETGIPRHNAPPPSPETLWTSQHYDIEEFKGTSQHYSIEGFKGTSQHHSIGGLKGGSQLGPNYAKYTSASRTADIFFSSLSSHRNFSNDLAYNRPRDLRLSASSACN